MRELWRGLLDLLLPPCCGGCGAGVEGSAPLCRRCDRALPRIPAGRCRLCQQAPPEAPGGRCGRCRASGSPLRACLAAAVFAGEVERWVHRLKYPRAGIAGLDPAPVAVLRMLVREAARRAPGPIPGWIVPVPLHPRRLRARGFNPAALLARPLARELGAPFAPLALRRVHNTPSQTGLDRRARRRNVRSAFQIRLGAHPPAVVWLVDDVVTTGSTLSEAARALRRGGVRAVVALCAARTPGPD